MAEDSIGKQVMDAIASPAKKVHDFVDKVTGHASSAPSSPAPSTGVETDYSRAQHAKDVAAANAAYAKTQAGQAHGQTPRRERLASKYGSGK